MRSFRTYTLTLTAMKIYSSRGSNMLFAVIRRYERWDKYKSEGKYNERVSIVVQINCHRQPSRDEIWTRN